jgi:hypothetical protein
MLDKQDNHLLGSSWPHTNKHMAFFVWADEDFLQHLRTQGTCTARGMLRSA